MKARKWGRIINVLNTYAKAPAASSAPTSVSRAAGMALTKVMASEGGEHNILVNAMLVGLIMSDQWVKRHAAQAPDTDFEVFAKNLAKGTPWGASARRRNSPTGLLPRLRAGIVHHRHRHQCRWRPLAGGVEHAGPRRAAAASVHLAPRAGKVRAQIRGEGTLREHLSKFAEAPLTPTLFRREAG
jgi:NAD(P)-dependent dehydrogenase (short-subunit alcohol dehydrogenase family)